ncbi:MAG: hypothetical protein Kow00129_11840 [Thermoleophilia bacterium]
MSAPGDSVTLEIPRERDFIPILHMVLGGIGLRRNMSFDALDDLQLAVDSLLDEDQVEGDGVLALNVEMSEDSVHIRLEGLRNPVLRATLEEGKVPAGAQNRCLDVCVLLRSLVDVFSVQGTDGPTFAVVLEKSVQ